MKVFAISDLHLSISGAKPMDVFGTAWDNYLDVIKENWQNNVSDDDVVILAGDLSWAMKLEEAKKDFAFFEGLKGTKVIVRGNHDYWWSAIGLVRQALPNKFIALQNDAVKIENYVFCGTRGWTVPEFTFAGPQEKKIFDREVIRLEMALKSAKSLMEDGDNLICVIHYPPFNTRRMPNPFLDLIEKYKVDNVVYGHLHGSKGRTEYKTTIKNTDFHLTSCDLLKNQLALISEE